MKRILTILVILSSFSAFSQKNIVVQGFPTPVAGIGSGPSILFIRGDTLYNRGLIGAFALTFAVRPDSSILVTIDTVVTIATKNFVDSLFFGIHPGSQLLSIVQKATTDSVYISNGNGIAFPLATPTLAGLMDSARAHTVDSVRNKLWATTWELTLDAPSGSALNSNHTITFPSRNLIWSAQGTGKFELFGMLQDTANLFGVLTKKNDSSTSNISFANFALRLPLKHIHTIFTPTTGGTVTLVNNQMNIINPSGSLSTLTVNYPASPVNGDVVIFVYEQAVTTVTYGGGTSLNSPTAPTGGTLVYKTFDSGTSTWL